MPLFCCFMGVVLPERYVVVTSSSTTTHYLVPSNSALRDRVTWERFFYSAEDSGPTYSTEGTGARTEEPASHEAGLQMLQPLSSWVSSSHRRSEIHKLAIEETKTPASGLRRSKFLFRKGWEGKGFSSLGRKKSKFKCLVPTHPHLNFHSNPSNFWCSQQSSYPKRGEKKDDICLFLGFEMQLAADCLKSCLGRNCNSLQTEKRRAMPLYSITVAVTSAEKAKSWLWAGGAAS